MISTLDFEKPVAALEERITQLRSVNALHDVDVASEIGRLETKRDELLASTYASLTPWQKTQVARHPQRPHFHDYVAHAFSDFVPLGGDRLFGDDQAIMGGFARLNGRRVMLIGHEKGNDTQSRIKHNFGMGKPEGYRKAIRLMELAGRFALPVVTLVDTSGAFPGIEAEERGQAEAIARSTEACLALPVPMVAVIVGEGGSGGALGIGVGDRLLMMEHSVYSVAPPEACAAILWRDAGKSSKAAEALKITSEDLMGLGIIDEVITEPTGAAHADPVLATEQVKAAILANLLRLDSMTSQQRRDLRYSKFRNIGKFSEGLG
jgi:acetyl-CoA carboxylase carboxyl transferase subunit alpha